MLRLAKGCSSYGPAIYTDSSVTNGTAIGGGGIVLTVDHPSNPTIHYSYVIPAGIWCAPIQAENKLIKTALQITQTEESHQKVPIVGDSESVLLHIANLQPAIPLRSADESDILSVFATLHNGGHQITFTWCPLRACEE